MTIAQTLLHAEFYRYLITCTDYFSKWPEAQALPSKCAAGVANFLLSLITRFGCFQICISDQGREFVNEINNNLFALAGVEHRVSSVYHPQTNGLDERMNQTITKAIMKYLNSEIEDWDEHIDAVLFSYRTSIHASTKYTPFFLCMEGMQSYLYSLQKNHQKSLAQSLNCKCKVWKAAILNRPTKKGSNLRFEVVKESFVQILHNGTNHWMTVSTINTQPSHINIYDSKYSTITESLRDQICALMHSCQQTITVHHINTDKQENGHDCGLYAIAYATSLCNGDDVTSVHYNSQKMREHLVQCLQARQMLNFPSNMVKRAQTFVNEELINLYCHCRQPQSSFMIECSGCSEWYHKECETSIPKTAYYL